MPEINQQKAQQIWVRCFNPTTNALRTGGTTANPPADTAFQWAEVLNRIFDDTAERNRLRFNG